MNVSLAQEGTVKIDGTVPDAYPFSETVANGTVIILEAVPAEGYEFTGWSGGLTGYENPVTIEMTCNKDITAGFAEKKFNLTVVVNGSGSVSTSSGGYIFHTGDTVTITASPDAGYRFDGWTGDVSDTGSASTTITIDSDKTVIANFARVISSFTLNIEVNGAGSVTPSAGAHSYDVGDVVTVTASPNSGYRFDSWTGDVSNTGSASTTITIDSDKTVTANFARVINSFTLNIEANGAGSVTPPSGAHSYDEGTIVNITAVPDAGYRFDNWTGGVGNPAAASTSITMNSDKNVTANFSRAGVLTPPVLAVIIAGGIVVIGLGGWLIFRKRRMKS